MNPPNERGRGKLAERKAASSKELGELKAKIQDMQMEIDILKETIDVLKRPRHQQGSVKQRGKGRRARKYCSYEGKISPEVPNVIQRNFKADKPNQKWLTDVTEFSISAGKVYLFSVIDCYDGMPIV